MYYQQNGWKDWSPLQRGNIFVKKSETSTIPGHLENAIFLDNNNHIRDNINNTEVCLVIYEIVEKILCYYDIDFIIRVSTPRGNKIKFSTGSIISEEKFLTKTIKGNKFEMDNNIEGTYFFYNDDTKKVSRKEEPIVDIQINKKKLNAVVSEKPIEIIEKGSSGKSKNSVEERESESK